MCASRPEFSRRGGEDFYTLRSYQEGDDLRRVHWASSAKLDELMIRQMETPWQSRALVFFDVRRRATRTPKHLSGQCEERPRSPCTLAAALPATSGWVRGSSISPRPGRRSKSSPWSQPVPAIDLQSGGGSDSSAKPGRRIAHDHRYPRRGARSRSSGCSPSSTGSGCCSPPPITRAGFSHRSSSSRSRPW